MLCDVAPCGKPVKVGPNGRPNGKGMCSMHYERTRRLGSPWAVSKVTFHCSIDDCSNAHYGNGFCNKHYVRMWRNGTLETKIAVPGHENPSYNTMHKRVKYARGAASEHDCVDCGDQAYHWSYNHSGEMELEEAPKGKYLFRYGTDVMDYEARCVPCHKKFDLATVA